MPPKSKKGWLQLLAVDSVTGSSGGKSFSRVYVALSSKELTIFASDAKDEKAAYGTPVKLTDATVQVPDISRVSKRHALEIVTAGPRSLIFAAESKDEQEGWLQAFSVATVRESWPGGLDAHKAPAPLLVALWENAAPVGTPSSARSISTLFPRLPALKSVPLWQRRSLLLRKFRLCSITFDGYLGAKGGPEREIKRNTLLECLDYVNDAIMGVGGSSASASGAGASGPVSNPCAPRNSLADARFMDDLFAVIRCNLFRTLPTAPPPMGNPDEVEETAFEDPQWPHLSIVYEILLRLVTSDALDLTLKKKLVDAPFVSALLHLLDSEDPRERDYLKTIAHRVYSKITQRRAMMRRCIMGIFADFIYEPRRTLSNEYRHFADSGSSKSDVGTAIGLKSRALGGWSTHNGIGELLEVLASVINGFAVPIKDEHKTMLMRSLMPLHKAEGDAMAAYFPQLSYCVSLYVSKEHTLSRDVVRALLRQWPIGATNKQMALLNELEDLFEYIDIGDMLSFAAPLAHRIAKMIGGYHFQVAERALCLWNNERFVALAVDNDEVRAVLFPLIFASLWTNQERHWHELIRNLSLQVLEKYANVDPKLLEDCKATMAAIEAEAEAQAGEAEAAAAAAASASASSSAASPGFQSAASPTAAATPVQPAPAASGSAAADAAQLARLAEVQRQVSEMRAQLAQQAMAAAEAAAAAAAAAPAATNGGSAFAGTSSADDFDDEFEPADSVEGVLASGFSSLSVDKRSPQEAAGRASMAPTALKRLLNGRGAAVPSASALVTPVPLVTHRSSAPAPLQESVAAGMRAITSGAALSPSLSPGSPAGLASVVSPVSPPLGSGLHLHHQHKPPAVKTSQGFFLGSSGAGGERDSMEGPLSPPAPHHYPPHPHHHTPGPFSPPSPRHAGVAGLGAVDGVMPGPSSSPPLLPSSSAAMLSRAGHLAFKEKMQLALSAGAGHSSPGGGAGLDDEGGGGAAGATDSEDGEYSLGSSVAVGPYGAGFSRSSSGAGGGGSGRVGGLGGSMALRRYGEYSVGSGFDDDALHLSEE